MDAAGHFAAYDAFGERRTGSSADRASSRWLAARARAAGAVAARVPVRFSRFVPVEGFVEVEGRRIVGLPLFDGGTTAASGVEGTVGPVGSDASIGVLELSPRAASLPDNDFARLRATSRHAAIVVALQSRCGSLAPLNAHDSQAPFGPPVLQVAAREGPPLLALAARGGATARVVATGTRIDGVSANVVARLAGGEAPPLVVLTPRTSWWTSTAERAGGLLAWLEVLRACAALPPSRRRPVIGLSTCGHEIGHLGAHRAFADAPSLARDCALVLHLGANLGAADDARLIVRARQPGLADRMADALVAAGHPPGPIEVETGGVASGEAHEIDARGGPWLSLIGANPWFHAPEDRWPDSIDLQRAICIARAAAAFAMQGAGMPRA